MTQLKKIIPGITLCFLISVPAWFLGNALPIIGSPVFGILGGMIFIMFFPGMLVKERQFAAIRQGSRGVRLEDGVKYTSKKLLQYSIILLGFGMNLFHVVKVGGQSLYVIVFTLTASFVTAYFVGKFMNLDAKVATLIGVGTSICGGSAIAATAPVISARDEDVAHAISTIFLFNILAVFLTCTEKLNQSLCEFFFPMLFDEFARSFVLQAAMWPEVVILPSPSLDLLPGFRHGTKPVFI